MLLRFAGTGTHSWPHHPYLIFFFKRVDSPTTPSHISFTSPSHSHSPPSSPFPHYDFESLRNLITGSSKMMSHDFNDEQHQIMHASQDDEVMESLILDDDGDDYVHRQSHRPTPPHSPNSPFNSFLDPPSYADAIFTSFDSNGHDQAIDKTPARSGCEDYLHIVVTDPQKEQDLATSLVPGSATFYTYLITTRTNFPEFGGEGTEFAVRRRFRDVVTLADRLSETYRGFFIPVRPDKSTVESQVMQKQEFVEQRRVALEKYLRKLAAHPVIGRSEELRAFLEAKGRLPLARTTDVASRMLDGAVRLPRQLFGGEPEVTEVAQPAKGGRDLLRIFKELKQSVTIDWVGSKPLVVEEDKEFIERKDKLVDFEHHLSNVSQQAESLVKFQQDMGETVGELGLAFVKLTKFETEDAIFESQRVRAADMKNVATAAVKASRLYRELNTQTIKHLDKLHEYLGTMLAVNNAFSDRSSALLTVQTLSSELASLHSRVEKLEVASSKIFGGDKSRLRKIDELKEAIRVTENAKICADREYERIKENNRSELERIDQERNNDFQSMLRGFVVNQAGYAEKMAAVWEKLAEETAAYSRDSS
ncbi:Sorting nexin [Vigna angularis]|uniref:Sorting nexin n=2 Tax=Phaseolus angularis TaxID=3914 RepID=A0A8T0K256_PHAAN|nr:sorting nexin 2B [Vigna angularis]KAG2391167.1 Sorting nexin [Vigna angularis]